MSDGPTASAVGSGDRSASTNRTCGMLRVPAVTCRSRRWSTAAWRITIELDVTFQA